jgi:hypothetical protein
MAKELAFVLINPYTVAKSRTGGVIARYISRTGLDFVAARMFAPNAELARSLCATDPQRSGDRSGDPADAGGLRGARIRAGSRHGAAAAGS